MTEAQAKAMIAQTQRLVIKLNQPVTRNYTDTTRTSNAADHVPHAVKEKDE